MLSYLDINPENTSYSTSVLMTTGYPPWGVSNTIRVRCSTDSSLCTTLNTVHAQTITKALALASLQTLPRINKGYIFYIIYSLEQSSFSRGGSRVAWAIQTFFSKADEMLQWLNTRNWITHPANSSKTTHKSLRHHYSLTKHGRLQLLSFEKGTSHMGKACFYLKVLVTQT